MQLGRLTLNIVLVVIKGLPLYAYSERKQSRFTKCLQRVQNAAARLIFELGRPTREHVTAIEPPSVSLAAGPLAGPVQAVLSHALSLLR